MTDQARFGDALAEPRFLVVFGARSLGVVADALRTVAVSVLVFEASNSPLLAAVTYGIAYLPQVIGGVFLGSLADRLPPRALISAGFALLCAIELIIALAEPSILVSLLLVATVAVSAPIFAGSTSRVVTEVLTGDVYVLGRSLFNIAASAGQLVGLALGGLAVAGLGGSSTVLISAGLHASAAATVWFLLRGVKPPGTPSQSQSILTASLANTRALLGNTRVRVLLLAQCLPPSFVTGAESLMIPYASARGATPATAGMLLACLPVGMIVGDFVVGRFVRSTTRERLTVPLMAVLGAPLVLLAFSLPLVLVAVLLMISGVGFAYGLGLQRRFLYAVAEPERGLAFGLLATGAMTLQGVGPVIFGTLTEAVSTSTAIALAGVATVASAGWLGISLRHHAPIEDEGGRVLGIRSSRKRGRLLHPLKGGARNGMQEDIWPEGRPMTGAGEEVPLTGGDITEGLVRVGNTVRRPHLTQSPAVAAYMAHVVGAGFTGVPRWHGRDDKGRDVFDFIEGSVPGNPPESWAVTDEVVAEIAVLLRRLHDASESFVPPSDAKWFGQQLQVQLPADLERLYDKPELISHCDVTPQNTVFRDGHPVALIDWDVSRPTTRLLDVLDTATWWVPLTHPTDRAPAFADGDVPARLRLFLDSYGLDQERRDQFLPLAHRAARRSWYLMQAAAEQNGGGWARMWSDGVGHWLRRRQEWLAAEHDTLEKAIRNQGT
ncbi:MFS transporter [Actinoplanes sp. GCM10030250]|uniref:MFS transporter n=1 Tax=Actinoplanes sp. GCM10030250 TaxID=3273376 RepID=UPI00360EB1F9